MIKAEMLNQIDHETILKMMLPSEAYNQVKKDVDTFFSYRHKLPKGVLNAILVRAIKVTGNNLFNVAYLRKVAETFKAEGIKSTVSAIEYVETEHDKERKLLKTQRSNTGEPDWMNDYIKDLAAMRG